MYIDKIIKEAIAEDVGVGDYTSLSTIPKEAQATAKLVIKEAGILAGVDIAKKVFEVVDSDVEFIKKIEDGVAVDIGDIVFKVKGSAISILTAERLALNFMQRMSGIATNTNKYVKLLKGTYTKVLDTRKTTPLLRELEKYSVKVGGGENHRFALYDMIMIKDNHIDFAGGIIPAIKSCNKYLADNKLNLKIEVEVRNLTEVIEVLQCSGVDRIMLDNFTPSEIEDALLLIDGIYETEASGGITEETIRAYAETGVDFISVGALTHHIKSLDMSLVSDIG
ncbi:MAG: carboxylating nicotinate-nucleotide diphosphorylase [Bacteroidetes bacterium]|nr:MAG: carboxylating nicotinate-nucleotide diphosphorylase [Bacteroidota bacterium]